MVGRRIVVIPRPGFEGDAEDIVRRQREGGGGYGGGVERVEGLGEVSSTEARETREIERLKVLVGEEVAKFIVEKGMYGWGEDGGKEG